MTEPLVPPEVDLRGLPWMRLDTSRLLDSDLFALSTGDEFKAAVALWCKSWTQEPAGSLPTDDRILAHLSGSGTKWKRVREMALRGWVECSDGRLYHPVVAEQALAAWEERVAYREKIDGQNTRQQKLRAERAELMADLKAAGVHLTWNTPIAEIRARHADLSQTVTPPDTGQSQTCHGDSHGLDGTGRDGNKELTEANASDAGASPDPPPDPIWGTGLAFLTRRGIPEKQARSLLGKVKQACGDIEAGALLARAEAEDITDPAPWLMAAASRARAGPNGRQVGKQMQGIMALEEMIHERKRMAGNRDSAGPATARLLISGSDAGG